MSLPITGISGSPVNPPGLLPVNVLTSTTGNVVLTESDILSGNIALTATAARTITLPAPKAGYNVRFTINANVTGGALTLSATGAIVNGVLLDGATPEVVRSVTSVILAVFVATPTGAGVGDYVEFRCVDGSTWSVFGLSKNATTFTTA